MLGAYGLIPRKNAGESEKAVIDYFNKIADVGYKINESLRHFSNLFDEADLDSITDDEWDYMLKTLMKLYMSIHKCDNDFDNLFYDTQKTFNDKNKPSLAYAENLKKRRKVD